MIDRLKFRGKVVKPIELGSIFTGGNEVPVGEWIIAPSDGWNLGVFFTYVTLGNIDPSTVGQYTGLKDSKGVEIYEGDIIESGSDSGFTAVVVFEDGQFTGHIKGLHDLSIARGWSDTITVIGNVHDKEQGGEMSHDGNVTVFSEIKYRFTGAQFIDNALYAIANVLEAISGLLTLGWWFWMIGQWYTERVQDVFFEQYGDGSRPRETK